MAVSAVVGLVTAIGASVAMGFTATVFFGAFALGAGISAVSNALIPKPDLGSQMRGTTVTTRDAAGPRKIIYGQARVGGNVVFIAHSGDDNKYLHLAVVFATHYINSYEEVWFNDNKIWTASGGFQSDWGTYVTMDTTKLGTSGQSASSVLTPITEWTSDHKLSGIAYIAFKLEWNQDKFPQGVPNITAVIKGKRVFDPRTNVTAYSTNPALCVRDYLLDSTYGLGEINANIDSDALEAAADLCDEQVSLDGGGTQDRYQCNGVIDTSNQIKANIENLLSSMGGRIAYSNGKYFIQGAEYVAPTFSFDESNTISAITIQTKQSRRSVYNGVKGTFISEEKNYKIMDYPAQLSSTYETEDGDPVYLDMPLPFVTNNLQAQRIAKIALLKSRQQVVLSMTVNLSGLKVKVGDTVNITNERLGYSNKVFEVIDYELMITPSGESGVKLTLIETAAAVYSWTTSDEVDFLSGGELDLYDGRTVDNVTSLAFTEIGFQGPDGQVLSAVELTWTEPDDAFIEFYKIRYNKNGTTDYLYAESREPRVFISGLDITSNYDFRVQAQNLLGVSSTGTTLTNQALNGDTTAPSAPSGGAATGGVQTITAEWDNPSDIDFKHTEVFVNTSDSIPASPTAVVDGEEYIVTGLSGAQTRYFWLKAVDFSGNKSAATASFSGTSVQVGGGDIEPGEIQGKTLALLLNKTAEGNTATGEGALVGVNLDGTPNLGSDGSIVYNGSEITIEHNQYASGAGDLTIATQLANKRGYIVFDINKTKPFQMAGALGNWNCAFVHLDSGTFYYDNNSSTRVSFDPNSFTGTQTGTDGSTTAHVLSLGVLETSTADNILAGGLYGEPRDLVTEEIPEGAVDITQFASGINPVQVVSTLPATAAQGDMAFLTTDNKLYRYNGSAWTLAVDGADVTDGTLPADAIVANSLTAGQIQAGAIGADEISVTNLAAINSDLGTLTAGTIDASVVTVSNLSATSITTDTLDADRISIDGVTLDTNASGQLIIADDGVSDDQVLSLDGSQTTITNLQVANLSGDVSEVFNLSVFVYPYHSVPEGASNADTFAEFTIPAPDSSLNKYASLNGKVKYIPSTSLDDCILVMQFERKSKGTSSGTLIGGVVGIVGSGTTGSPYQHYVEISGNHTKEIDAYGGIAQSQTSPSNVSKPQAVEYKSATNRTRIIYSGTQQSTPTYTTGSLYYNPDRWISSGSWLDDAAGAQRYPIPDVGSISTSLTLPLNQPLAKSSAAEDYRVRVNTLGRSSGTLNLSSIDSQIFLMT